ncbi:hypothetical protein SJPD1_2293 [Sulfurospirillum diekertiae]|uniref:Uncharacterized protein n=1 Tax=Sulfurospirillum diekertiae TaxID=1854492 RepID=A0A290HYE8_9BACT|nr:hypothetical protein [Sulfurospirillum diekertiae]ATB70389.1 hypothetical protein SJPD1_2293 [Sulfurospirillum diekertiae]
MINLGNGKYKIFLGTRFTELTENEIVYFLEDAQYFLENNLEDLGYVNIHHHPTDEILIELKKNYPDDIIHDITSVFEEELREANYINLNDLDGYLEDDILDNYEEELNEQGYFKEDEEQQEIKSTKQEKCNKKQQRGYNPNLKIKQLFAKYYDDTKTKREIFTKISKELKISFKAVEKAFYLK